jgi:hypothetical protein
MSQFTAYFNHTRCTLDACPRTSNASNALVGERWQLWLFGTHRGAASFTTEISVIRQIFVNFLIY